MNRKQNYNQNQNQQRSNHNSNSSASSSSNDRSRNNLWINRNNPDRNSRNNNIVIGVADDQVNSERNQASQRRDLLNPEQNQQQYNEMSEILAAKFDPVNINRMRNVEIREYLIEQREYVSKWAMTIGGCESLRGLLAAEDGGKLRETILTTVAADLPNLMVHDIGSRFVRAFFSSCNEGRMNRVLQSIFLGNELAFSDIFNNYCGSESGKALIQNLRNDAQLSIVTNGLAAEITAFTNFKYRKIVLDFFIYTYNHNSSKMRLLINAMANECLVIARNELGCRTLQHAICPMFINRGLISSLLDAIVVNVLTLANDKYGNNLIRHVIDANIEGGVTKRIVEALVGRFCKLAQSQSGSVVVEKCLEKCEQREVVKIVGEFTNSPQLRRIAQHPYGHYVIQCALLHVANRGTVQHYRNLVDGINLHAPTLKDHIYGGKVIRKIKELNSMSPFLFPR